MYEHSMSKQDVNRTLHSKTELEHVWRVHVHVCVYVNGWRCDGT